MYVIDNSPLGSTNRPTVTLPLLQPFTFVKMISWAFCSMMPYLSTLFDQQSPFLLIRLKISLLQILTISTAAVVPYFSIAGLTRSSNAVLL